MKIIREDCYIVNGKTKVYTKNSWAFIKNIGIGDYVLTHKGRYRKVLKTFKYIAEEFTLVRLFIRDYKKAKRDKFFITVTGNHPVLIKDKGWVDAEKVGTDDSIYCLAEQCRNCGKPIIIGTKYCNRKCSNIDLVRAKMEGFGKSIYKFTPFEIKKVEVLHKKCMQVLYNLAVEEDESYIAKGFILQSSIYRIKGD